MAGRLLPLLKFLTGSQPVLVIRPDLSLFNSGGTQLGLQAYFLVLEGACLLILVAEMVMLLFQGGTFLFNRHLRSGTLVFNLAEIGRHLLPAFQFLAGGLPGSVSGLDLTFTGKLSLE